MHSYFQNKITSIIAHKIIYKNPKVLTTKLSLNKNLLYLPIRSNPKNSVVVNLMDFLGVFYQKIIQSLNTSTKLNKNFEITKNKIQSNPGIAQNNHLTSKIKKLMTEYTNSLVHIYQNAPDHLQTNATIYVGRAGAATKKILKVFS